MKAKRAEAEAAQAASNSEEAKKTKEATMKAKIEAIKAKKLEAAAMFKAACKFQSLHRAAQARKRVGGKSDPPSQVTLLMLICRRRLNAD